MIQRNRHPAGRIWNMVFGLAQIIDGIVRIVTLGFFQTNLPLTASRLIAVEMGQQQVANRLNQKT